MDRDRTILVVDDDPKMASVTVMNLESEGFRAISALDGESALQKIRKELPDLVLLDILMPEMDGYQTLQRIREISDLPVVFLTSLGDEPDRIRGLDLGADDYIAKPVSGRELSSRIGAVLRRYKSANPAQGREIFVDEDLQIDFDECKVTAKGKEVHLRPTEHRLLYHLVTNAGRLLSHETLLARVWGPEYQDEDHYVRLYITYLRQKIEPDPKQPRYIIGERGLGYRFKSFDK